MAENSRENKIDLTTSADINALPKSELKARLAQVLNRSVVEDRLQVALPPELHGEWVLDDPVEIARKEALGFKVNRGEYGSDKGLHDDATGRIKVGDLVHVYIPKETKQVIDEIAWEKYKRDHMGKEKKEEKDLRQALSASDANSGPAIIQSKDSTIKGVSELVESLPKS